MFDATLWTHCSAPRTSTFDTRALRCQPGVADGSIDDGFCYLVGRIYPALLARYFPQCGA